jgi:hypothetical protein
MKLCCASLYSICKPYEPQLCKAALVACRANLIFTPRDDTNGYFSYFHELMPYHKLDRHPEQKTPTPDKLHEHGRPRLSSRCRGWRG